jgi:hypothetical protein
MRDMVLSEQTVPVSVLVSDDWTVKRVAREVESALRLLGRPVGAGDVERVVRERMESETADRDFAPVAYSEKGTPWINGLVDELVVGMT